MTHMEEKKQKLLGLSMEQLEVKMSKMKASVLKTQLRLEIEDRQQKQLENIKKNLVKKDFNIVDYQSKLSIIREFVKHNLITQKSWSFTHYLTKKKIDVIRYDLSNEAKDLIKNNRIKIKKIPIKIKIKSKIRI